MPVTTRALVVMKEILADGEWHVLREVIIEGAAYVPETRALATNEKARISVSKYRQGKNWLAPQERTLHRERSELIRMGAYRHAYSVLEHHLRYQKHKYERRDGRVRLKPKDEPCPTTTHKPPPVSKNEHSTSLPSDAQSMTLHSSA